MQEDKIVFATCKAPVNIAVIKYWGKRNEELMLPLNDSVSVTLDTKEMCAHTTVATSKYFTKDKIWLNGLETSVKNPRVQNCLREVRKRVRHEVNERQLKLKYENMLDWHVHICSENNFPTAAGLASSAAGYACLAYSLVKLYGVDIDVSGIARQGSGSACRSVFGGFVHWLKGKMDDGSDSIAYQIAPANHWPELRLLILVVNDKKKSTSSSTGMQNSVETSGLLKYRVSTIIDKRTKKMIEAINKKDFETFSTITMQESNQLHAICLDTWPPITYLNDVSRAIMYLVCQLNKIMGRNIVAYTFDAGPNGVLIAQKSDIPFIAAMVKYFFPCENELCKRYFRGNSIDNVNLDPALVTKVGMEPTANALRFVIHTKVGNGPRYIINPEESLLNSLGIPK